MSIQNGQLPVKVIAEIKITDKNTDYFFNAFGSGPRDNVRQAEYGGIVCLYNAEEVRVYAPKSQSGYVLFLGKEGRGIGPKFSNSKYKTGEIRVKVWKKADMQPSTDTGFKHSISIVQPFLEIPLSGEMEPDMVVVQIRPVDTNPLSTMVANSQKSFFSDVISEAIGLPSCFDKCGEDGGGVVFAYNSSTLRLWANSYGKIMSTVGWGMSTSAFTSKSAQVRILTWHFEKDPQKCLLSFTSKTMFSSSADLVSPSLNFTHTEFSLVLAKLRVPDGVNEGFIFYGSGSVVLAGMHGGGFVFGYAAGKVLTWFLDTASSRKGLPVFRIMYPWGNGIWNQTSSDVEIEINVFPLVEKNVKVCDNPLCAEGNSVLVSQNLTSAEYKCQPGYVHQSGDLVKYCYNNKKWEGETKQPVECVAVNTTVQYSTNDFEPSAISTPHPYSTAFTSTSIATSLPTPLYTSSPTSSVPFTSSTPTPVSISSTPSSTLLSTTSPTTLMLTPESLSTSASQTSNSIIKSTDQCRVEGTHVNYSCSTGPQQMVRMSESLICQCHLGYHLKSGDLKRTCLKAGEWSGGEPVCVAAGSCMCPCNKVTNPIYTDPNDAALWKEIQRMKRELIVLKNMTNKALRKKISVPDFRPSATVSGTPWVLLLVAMVLWIVVPDVWTVIQQLKILLFQTRL